MLQTLGIDAQFIFLAALGFILLFLILRKYTFGPVYNILQQRQESIRNNLDEAQARRDEMVRLQREYEERLAKIEDEARDKIQAAVRDAQAARDEILARAHAESEAIVQRGQEEVTRERERAMLEMRNQIAELAVTAAGRVIKQSLNTQSHAALIEDVINGIGAPAGGAR